MFESKINRGRANGYAPLDSGSKVPLSYLPPIQSTIDTGSFVTTGSNQFNGNQSISGSITAAEFIQTSNIQGTGSLYLKPDSNDSRHFEIYNTSPTDTHIKANGGISFFGDDTNYVKIEDVGDVTIRANSTVTIQSGNGDIILNPDGGAYLGSSNGTNSILTSGYLANIIGDANVVNNGTGHTITDNLTNIINSIPSTSNFATTSSLQALSDKTGSFATTGSNTFNGSQIINGPLTINVSTGTPSGVSNWEGQGGWNQGFYSNITASGGTGTGLTVDVAAGGGGYINIGAISINNPGSGYTNGDIVTINNENDLPGQFTIAVSSTNVLQCDVDGNLILDSSNVPTNLTGSIGDKEGTLVFDDNYLHYCIADFVPETYQIIVNPGATYNTHVSIPKNQSGIPNLYSNGFSITTQDDTTYYLTGVYSDGDNWDCEIDSLNSNYNGGTQTMTLTWLDYESTNIWKKVSLNGIDSGSLLTTSSFNTFTSSYTTDSASFDSRINNVTGSVASGTISSSIQITNLGFATTSSVVNVNTSSLLLTSSFNVFATSSNEFTSSINTFTSSINTTIKSKLNTDGVISGSTQVLNGTSIYSSSAQLPSGLVSGSFQITGLGYALTSSLANVTPFLSASTFNTFTSSYTTTSSSFDSRINAIVNGSGFATTSSLNAYTASINTYSASINTYISSMNSYTASINSTTASLNGKTGSYATTGSNQFKADQTITGSLTVTALTTISSSISANSSSLYLTSGSNLYVQNGGLVEITGSVTLSGSMTIQSGSIMMPNRPAFRVTGAGGPTYATTVLSGSMVVVDYNEGGHYNTTNGTFTAPIAGLYQVNLVCRTYSNSGAASQAVVVKNNTAGTNGTVQIMLEWAANTTVNHIGGSTISKLAVGDTLKAVVFMGSASFDANDNFSIAYIG